MTGVTRTPPAASAALSVVAAGGAVASLALVDAVALAPAALGSLALLVGLARASRRLVTAGAAGLLVGVGVAGALGGGPEPLLVALVGTALAWDSADHGIGVGEHLGREADSTRVVAVHAAGTLAVATLAAGVGYGVYRAASGGQPVTAVVFLLVGVVALAAALRGS